MRKIGVPGIILIVGFVATVILFALTIQPPATGEPVKEVSFLQMIIVMAPFFLGMLPMFMFGMKRH